MRAIAQADVSFVATDVGLWMSLPAFGPALLVAGVVIYVARRDRRKNSDPIDGVELAAQERNDPECPPRCAVWVSWRRCTLAWVWTPAASDTNLGELWC